MMYGIQIVEKDAPVVELEQQAAETRTAETPPQTVGARLRAARQPQMSLTKLAGTIHFSKGYVSGVETGAITPSLEFLTLYAQALGVPLEHFIAAGEREPAKSKKRQRQVGAVARSVTIRSDKVLMIPTHIRLPSVAQYTGYEKELGRLGQFIFQDSAQIIGVTGMVGMGKSTLCAQFLTSPEKSFARIIWWSFSQAPLLAHVVTALGLRPDALDTRDMDDLHRLLEYLNAHRCLVVIDDVDLDLGAGADESQGDVRNELHQFLALSRTIRAGASKLLVVTSDRSALVGIDGDPLVAEWLTLNGIDRIPTGELLKNEGILATPTARDALHEFFLGNPEIIKRLVPTIKELFGGNLDVFLKRKEAMVSLVEPVMFNQFARLTDLERDCLTWLAIACEPLRLTWLQQRLVSSVADGVLLDVLRKLSLQGIVISKQGNDFDVSPFIREYCIQHFLAQVVAEFKQVNNTFDRDSLAALRRFSLLWNPPNHAMHERQRERIVGQLVKLLITAQSSTLTAKSAKKQFADRCTHFFAAFRREGRDATGYAVGNLINILVHMESDLMTGLDLSELYIRRAYLQNVTAHNVNLTKATCKECWFFHDFDDILSVAYQPQQEYDPDRQYVAFSTATGEIRLIGTKDAVHYMTLRGHTDWVWSVAFNGKGDRLASAGTDRTIRLWDPQTGSGKVLAGHDSWVRSVAFNYDGTLLASGSEDRQILVWDVEKAWRDEPAQLLRLKYHQGWVRSLAFHPAQNILVSAGEDGIVVMWRFPEPQQGKSAIPEPLEIIKSGSPFWSVAFSADGTYIAAGGDNGNLYLRNMHTGTLEPLQPPFESTSRIRAIAFSREQHLLACANEAGFVQLWDVESQTFIDAIDVKSRWVRSIAFSQDGRELVTGSEDQQLSFWELAPHPHTKKNTDAAASCRMTLQGFADRVCAIAFMHQKTTDEKIMLASASQEERTVQLWDIHESFIHANTPSSAAAKMPPLLGHTEPPHKNRIRSIAFHPSKPMLASGSEDQSVQVIDLDTGSVLLTIPDTQNSVWSVAFDPNQDRIAFGSGDHYLRIWHISENRLLWDAERGANSEQHTDRVWSVAFSHDGNFLASGSSDRTVRLWKVGTRLDDIEHYACLRKHQGRIWSVAFNHDGTLLASGSGDDAIILWDVANKRMAGKPLDEHKKRVRSVAFSPDGKLLASGSEDHSVCLWDVSSQTLLARGETVSPVWSVAFSPDGRYIASGEDKGYIALWNVDQVENAVLSIARKWRKPRPYAGMRILGIDGLTAAQRLSLRNLGASDLWRSS